MTVPKVFTPVIRIAQFTIADEIRQRSFIVMFVICSLFIFMVRGCYQGDYRLDGQEIEAAKIIIVLSKITFHVIAGGMMFLAGLLAMRIFRRDRDDGTQSFILSKPISRRQYVSGKVLGLWTLLTVFMFVLHGIVFLITSVRLNIVMPEYLWSSAWCSINLFFIIVAVLTLSLMMPDVAALLCVVGIGIIGVVSNAFSAVSRTPIGQAILQHSQSDISMWQVIDYAWPQIAGVQRFAVSFIGANEFGVHASVYPVINILAYCILSGVLLFRRFGKEEII